MRQSITINVHVCGIRYVYMWIFVCVKHVENTLTMINVGKS